MAGRSTDTEEPFEHETEPNTRARASSTSGHPEALGLTGVPSFQLSARAREIVPPSRPRARHAAGPHKKELETGATKLNAKVGHFMVATIFGTRPPDGLTPIKDDHARLLKL